MVFRMTTPIRAPRAGMTLIEVMLAVVILSTGLIALLTCASRLMAVAGQAKNYETARRLLGQVEVESPLRLKEEIEEGTETGTFSTGEKGWTWERTIQHIGEEEEARDGLFLVTTRVRWSNRGKNVTEETVTYRYIPKNFEGVHTLLPNTP